MSQINVDNIKNRLGSGAPSFPNGIDVSSGVTTFTNGLNVGTGASVFSPATNVLALGTNSAERVRITSSGNVGIGTDNPLTAVHILSTNTGGDLTVERDGNGSAGPEFILRHTSTSPADNDYVGQITFNGRDDGNNNTTVCRIDGIMTDVTNGSEDGELVFNTRNNGTFTEKLRITSSGNIGIGTDTPATSNGAVGKLVTVYSGGNNVISGESTAGAGYGLVLEGRYDGRSGNERYSQVNLKTDGSNNGQFTISLAAAGGDVSERANFTINGLNFNGDTAAANALDDYEEGSWTPIFTNAGTLTYSIQVGRYTKIGNLVHATCHLDVNAKGSASGNLRVGGLPFTSMTDNNYHAVSSTVHGTSWSTARRSVNILLARNATATDIYHNMVGTTVSSNPSITGSDWGFVSHDDIGTGNLLFSITYQAA